jgi:L-threonylcarbamoyladenylate synthase
MEIIKVDYNYPDSAVVQKAAKILESGGIVIAPTETVYAIFGNALNKETIDKVLRLKKRNPVKGFGLTLFPIDRIFEYVVSDPLIFEIIEMFPDQPMSFALSRKKTLPEFLNPGFDSIAFHFFFSRLDEEIFGHIDIPLIGTSANISGECDVNSAQKVVKYFEPTFGTPLEPDLILDGGELGVSCPSAVVKLMGKDITVVRGGNIPREEMQKKLDAMINRL